MEVWISTNNEKIRFPVTPSVVGVDRSVNIETENVLKVGEVPTVGGYNLKTIEISSFFPARDYSFATEKCNPYELSNRFVDWIKRGQQFRLIVTDTNINMPCVISDFSTREQDGSRDLYFDMKLIEHRTVNIPKIVKENKPNGNATNRPAENTNKPTPGTQKTHKVVKGDSLWSIAQKYYGNGKLYPKIKDANKAKYTSLKTSNVIYTSMTLVIP